ncbi:hypothetical protein AB0301_16655 [Microbacterium profundi]|uniref:Response regulator n=1 Tax=Microbacterium profundi TaxID=450380 RepID=A0ABV3LMR3_9MICO
MSVEMITTLVGVVSMLLALAGGFGWMIHRMDSRVDSFEIRLGARIDDVETKLGARIDSVEEKLGARIDKVANEQVELKVAIARIEGPPRHLVSAR